MFKSVANELCRTQIPRTDKVKSVVCLIFCLGCRGKIFTGAHVDKCVSVAFRKSLCKLLRIRNVLYYVFIVV